MIDKNAKQWSSLIDLSTLLGFIFPFGNIIAPLIIWILKKNEHDFIDQNGRAAINFQISYIIYIVLIFVLLFYPILPFRLFNDFPTITVLLIFGLLYLVLQIILATIAASRAYNGNFFNYPLVIKFIRVFS